METSLKLASFFPKAVFERLKTTAIFTFWFTDGNIADYISNFKKNVKSASLESARQNSIAAESSEEEEDEEEEKDEEKGDSASSSEDEQSASLDTKKALLSKKSMAVEPSEDDDEDEENGDAASSDEDEENGDAASSDEDEKSTSLDAKKAFVSKKSMAVEPSEDDEADDEDEDDEENGDAASSEEEKDDEAVGTSTVASCFGGEICWMDESSQERSREFCCQSDNNSMSSFRTHQQVAYKMCGLGSPELSSLNENIALVFNTYFIECSVVGIAEDSLVLNIVPFSTVILVPTAKIELWLSARVGRDQIYSWNALKSMINNYNDLDSGKQSLFGFIKDLIRGGGCSLDHIIDGEELEKDISNLINLRKVPSVIGNPVSECAAFNTVDIDSCRLDGLSIDENGEVVDDEELLQQKNLKEIARKMSSNYSHASFALGLKNFERYQNSSAQCSTAPPSPSGSIDFGSPYSNLGLLDSKDLLMLENINKPLPPPEKDLVQQEKDRQKAATKASLERSLSSSR